MNGFVLLEVSFEVDWLILKLHLEEILVVYQVVILVFLVPQNRKALGH